MTEEEGLARRIRIAKAMGYIVTASTDRGHGDRYILWEPDGNRVTWQESEALCWQVGVPNPDTDPAAFLAVLEWVCRHEEFGWLEIFAPLNFVCVRFFHHVQLIEEESTPFAAATAATFAQAILAAIDAALRERKEGCGENLDI